MASILNLETTATACSVAVAENGNLISLCESSSPNAHGSQITILIEEAIRKANTSLKKLDAVSVSGGPGSYTGLRIGVSTAKGLCYALNKPLIAIDTLQSLAWKMASEIQEENVLLCPMIDARRMEVFTAIFDLEMNEVEKPSAKIVDEFFFHKTYMDRRIFAGGSGAAKTKTILRHPNLHFLDNIICSAANMAALSEKKFYKGQFENLAYFEPFYLKEFEGKKRQ